MSILNDKIQQAKDAIVIAKTSLANAITEKGVITETTVPFSIMAENIRNILEGNSSNDKPVAIKFSTNRNSMDVIKESNRKISYALVRENGKIIRIINVTDNITTEITEKEE